jgi:hypothetical protein
MMRWLRLKRRTGARLGLFALALQLVLSFGHIHPQDVLPQPILGTVAAIDQVSDGKSSSGHQAPSRLPDDDCPICMAVHASASVLPPAAPLVVLPNAFGPVSQPATIVAFDVSVPRHVLFQTRAPPLA